jgi:outer membrane protein OmpA-like peptidoglycan-associated protein
MAEDDFMLAAKSSEKEKLKIKTLKETAPVEKSAVKTVKPVKVKEVPKKKETPKKVENNPAKKAVTKPAVKKEQRAKPKQAEAEIDNTVDEIPQANDLPQAETSGLMFMDLDIINEQNKPIKAVMIVLSNDKGQLLRNYYSDLSGEVDLELKPNKTYMLRIEHEDFRSKTIMICTDGKTAKERIARKVLMKSDVKAAELNIKPIYFEKGDLGLGQMEQEKLNEVIIALKKNPNMTIKINGYTDALGDEKYNFDLSKKRAMAVAKYLIKNGISPNRMMPKGRGANELQNDCGVGVSCSDRLHEQNRRVEIEVLKF